MFSSRITNNLRVIQHAWHFQYAVISVFKCNAEAQSLRASHLNWALAIREKLELSGYQSNLESQLNMLNETWDSLISNGVTNETELVLEFSYLCPNKALAIQLNNALENYESLIRSEGFINRSWFVEGYSHPTTVTKDILAQWLDFMVTKGWEFQCTFDGFGASFS
ncbi:hypothetical protein M2G88_20985 [Vibrio vulnificus]|nr:hypothetical protein [Vibrio vulnificus]